MKPLAVFTFAAACAAADHSLWVSLFDGKSLQGWHVAAKAADSGKGFWQVREGAITCDSLGRKDHDYFWLIGDREYGDFELKLKIRGFRGSTGNSGVQVRSRYDEEAGWLDGPQIDVHPPEPFRTGLIYDETRGVRHWIFPRLPGWEIEPAHAPQGWKWDENGWNDLLITCKGARITTVLNGLLRADFDGSGVLDDQIHRARNVGMKGHIALQLHTRDELKIQYKDIYIRE